MFTLPFSLHSNKSNIISFSKPHLALTFNSGFLTKLYNPTNRIGSEHNLYFLWYSIGVKIQCLTTEQNLESIFYPCFLKSLKYRGNKTRLVESKLSYNLKVLKFRGPQIVYGNQRSRGAFRPGKQQIGTGAPIKTAKNILKLM